MQKIAATKTAAIRTAKARKPTAKTAITAMAGTTKKPFRSTPAPTKEALKVFVEPSDTDVNGSYTGRPKNKREKPVQDADDL